MATLPNAQVLRSSLGQSRGSVGGQVPTPMHRAPGLDTWLANSASQGGRRTTDFEGRPVIEFVTRMAKLSKSRPR
jgi:hypothetical protein